jgi:hypothetical protein
MFWQGRGCKSAGLRIGSDSDASYHWGGVFQMKIQAIVAIATSGSKQSVSVSTTPVQGAACVLHNSEGTWYVTSPGSVEVHKTKNDLDVTCTKDGYQVGKQVAISKFGGATFGNIVAGGIIGAGIDAASGANYYYDNPLTVPLGPSVVTPASVTAPAPGATGATPTPSTLAPNS